MKKFIGDKAFYLMVLMLVVPMIIQQGFTSVVNLLDNVMVGRLGTEAISAVAICSQFFFVLNITIFGGLSGASIFSAQFFGRKDYDGVIHTFRYKIFFGIAICLAAVLVFNIWDKQLIHLFLNETAGDTADLAQTMVLAQQYLKIMLWGIVPFMISQCFSSTLRESGNSVIAMTGSILAVLTNLIGNYLLIFGSFGFPRLGVEGAAIATVISRLVEAGFIVGATWLHRENFYFVRKAFKSTYIPAKILKGIAIKGSPLLVNEFIWSIATASLTANYAFRGITVVAALNISSTISQLFAIFFMAMGNAVGVLVGQQLGAGDFEKAKDTDNKLIFLNVCTSVVLGGLLVLLSAYIPLIYNTENMVRQMASNFLIIASLAFPLHAFNHSVYFTLRSGGRTIVTFFFDSVFTCLVSVPLAFFFSRYTLLPIVTVYLIVNMADGIKLIIGYLMLRSGSWARSIVA